MAGHADSIAAVQRLLGDISLADFATNNLHRLPLALPGAGRHLQRLGTWDAVARLLASPGADALTVRDGVRYADGAPRESSALRQLVDEGWTTLVRHAERHDPALGELAASFEAVFRSPVDVHVYLTPAGRFGFSWHYDAEDVFIVQTAGEKEYFLRKNTVNPWPLEETLPDDMQYERELMPLLRVQLRAGDVLYIPCGYWHRAEAAPGDAAISLAIGVMSRAAIDLFDQLRPELVKSLVWRQRLATGLEGDAQERYRALLEMLADDLHRVLKSPSFMETVMRQFARSASEGGRVEEAACDAIDSISGPAKLD